MSYGLTPWLWGGDMSLMYSIEKILYARNRSVPVFREYDGRRGFTAWSKECQEASPTGLKAESGILGSQGFTRVRVMPETDAQKIRSEFDREDAALRERKASAISQTLQVTNLSALKEVVAKAITPEVENILKEYFASEFCAYWYSMQRALPNKQAARAFLWHCDKGPTMHAKMLLYFTAVEDTGGNTYLVDRATTVALDKAGYVFGSQKDRVEDLQDFANRKGVEFKPFSFDMTPGEAILFLPQKVLHRGVLPTKAPRFIMQVTFLPSKMHWRKSLFQESGMNLDELARDYAWPQHATELRSALGG